MWATPPFQVARACAERARGYTRMSKGIPTDTPTEHEPIKWGWLGGIIKLAEFSRPLLRKRPLISKGLTFLRKGRRKLCPIVYNCGQFKLCADSAAVEGWWTHKTTVSLVKKLEKRQMNQFPLWPRLEPLWPIHQGAAWERAAPGTCSPPF